MNKRAVSFLINPNHSRRNFIKNAAAVSAGIVIAPKKIITHSYPIGGLRKIKDIIIYEDPMFYSSFPSIIKRPNGELIVAFRRAPDRKIFGEKGTNHVDPNSYLMMVRSNDGETWTKNPELVYAHPFGGSQDPCLLQLSDGTLLCASYGWAFVREDGFQNLKQPYFQSGPATRCFINRGFIKGNFLICCNRAGIFPRNSFIVRN